MLRHFLLSTSVFSQLHAEWASYKYSSLHRQGPQRAANAAPFQFLYHTHIILAELPSPLVFTLRTGRAGVGFSGWNPSYAASEMWICGQEVPLGMLLWLDRGRNWPISDRKILSMGPVQSSGAGMALQNCPKLGQGAWVFTPQQWVVMGRGCPRERA